MTHAMTNNWTMRASEHYVMQVLAWIWSLVISLSLLSIFYFSYIWIALLLLVSGIFVTLDVSRSEQKRHLAVTGNKLRFED